MPSASSTAAQIRESQKTNHTAIAERCIPSAILAPSAHNTQPWQFTVHNNTIEIFIDWQRHLKISDPTNRQLYISLGCTLTNIEAAARHFNAEAHIDYFPAGENKNDPVARVTITNTHPDPAHIFNDLFLAIEQRRTDRSLYDEQALTKDELQALPSAKQAGIRLITNREKISILAELTEQATERTLSRKDFKEELSHWVRNNWTRQSDGMPGYAMGMPAPISLLSSVMVRLAPIHKQEAPKTRQQMNSSSAVIVITTPGESARDWLRAGQQLEQLWLEAVAAGLGAMPQVAAIEAGEDIRQKVQETVQTSEFPQSILRLGHTKQKVHRPTPRRSFEECVIKK